MSDEEGQHRLAQQLRSWLIALWREPVVRNRALIVLAGVFVCLYGLNVIAYVLSRPDLGVRTAFSTVVNHFDEDALVEGQKDSLRRRDRIVRVGGEEIKDWAHLLRKTRLLRDFDPQVRTDDPKDLAVSRHKELLYKDEKIIRVDYARD